MALSGVQSRGARCTQWGFDIMRPFQWSVQAAAVGLTAVVLATPAASQPVDPIQGAETISIQEVASSGVQGRASLVVGDRHEQAMIMTIDLDGLVPSEPGLGRGRLTGIPDGVYSLLLDREPPPAESSAATLVIYGSLLVIVAIQVGRKLRSAFMLRHWRAQPQVRPRGRTRMIRHVVVPGLSNLAWAGVALVGLPTLLGGGQEHLAHLRCEVLGEESISSSVHVAVGMYG